jgi:hypothetical protein
MNEAEEDAKLRNLYVPYESTDPLWLDLARAGERLWMAEAKLKGFIMFDEWLLGMPTRHLRAIADGWNMKEVSMRGFIATVCHVMAETPEKKRRTVGLGRVMEAAKRMAEGRDGATSVYADNERKKFKRADDMFARIQREQLEDPFRLSGRLDVARPLYLGKKPPKR